MALITTRKRWKLMEGDKMDGLGYVRILFWQQSGQIFVLRRDYFIVCTYSKIKKRGNRLFLYYVNLKFRINFDPALSSVLAHHFL